MSSATARLPGVALTLPADFRALPLDADLARRVAGQSALLDELPMAAGNRRELVALYLEALAKRLRAADIAGAAFCAVRIDDHASTATLTVGFHEMVTTDRTLALLGTVASLRGSSGAADVRTTAYAGHPAAQWTIERPVADGVMMRERQVLVQAPGVPVAVLLSLATPTVQDWPIYTRLMRDICETLRFTPAEQPKGGAAAQVLLLASAVGTEQ